MSAPRVLLDATAIPAELGGVGRYVVELARALAADGPLLVICQTRDLDLFVSTAAGTEVVALPDRWSGRALRMLWEQVGLPRLARRLGAEVIHSPHYTLPLLARRPVVVTLHDALFFTDRDLHLGLKGRFFRAWTRIALRRAARCLVVSQATADDLVTHAKADPDRLTVIPLGCNAEVFHPPSRAETDRVRASLGLAGRPYVAFLGTLEPRKNVPNLIRAFTSAVDGRTDPPALVVAGGPGWDTQVAPALAAVPAGVTVLRPGYLPLADLAGYLGGAEVVAYPSLGEGFGLPVLEAMACGAAVLTTRRLALPEVGGDAVAYTEPAEPAITEALVELLDDPDRRAELGERAIARSAGFSWTVHATRCRQVYRSVVGPTPRSPLLPTPDRFDPADGVNGPPPPIGVVVVTYSPGPTLEAFLDSIPAATTADVPVVLADNGSTDGSVERAEHRFGVRLVRTGANLGFGGGANRGVAALPADREFALIANPDVVLHPGSVDRLLAAARRYPQAGAFGPAIVTPDGELYPSARRLPSLGLGVGHAALGWAWAGNPWTRTYRAEDTALVERVAGWLSGSCLLVRRSAFDAIGGFDERYFMYFEDVDLGRRLLQAGWSSVYVPEAVVTHIGGDATAKVAAAMVAAHHDSAYRYLAAQYPRPWQAPVRVGLKVALEARRALAQRSDRVSAGARLDGRRLSG